MTWRPTSRPPTDLGAHGILFAGTRQAIADIDAALTAKPT